MQDIHSIDTVAGSGDGRLFAGDGSDRRLRPHQHHLDLKCPRCESSNTKFCYFNNYNLSQPRHFCKSCRRYWTNGGVLRNVPVGGGIRKTKRSKQKSKNGVVPREQKSSNSENSSSDSSSLTAANTTATFATATEVSGSNSTNSMPATLINFNESSRTFFGIPQSSSPITTFNPLMSNQSSAGNLSSEIGTFTSLMTSGFNVAGDISSFPVQQQNQNPNNLQWMFMDHDQTAEIELPGLGSRRSNGGLAGTEYDQGLFDLTGAVDQSYWSQSHWNDHDNHLNYLP